MRTRRDDPRPLPRPRASRFNGAAFVRTRREGGALGLYGDFMLLQWSRVRENAESTVDSASATIICRELQWSRVRENAERPGRTPSPLTFLQLQWSRVRENAERRGDSSTWLLDPSLQWSRVRENAESRFRTTAPDGSVVELQWSRVRENAERNPEVRAYAAGGVASMEPRS